MEEEDSGEDSDFDFEENGIVFLNCIVLDISLDPFKDEGKQKSKEDLGEIRKYNFFGDSSKQLNISLVSVQKYPVRNGSFWLNDAVLLDRPTYMPMKKKPKLSHETGVMIKDNLILVGFKAISVASWFLFTFIVLYLIHNASIHEEIDERRVL